MAKKRDLHHPWLVAVWPGMGHVALDAGFYLLSKLTMEEIAELEADDLFDVDAVEIKDGIIQVGRRPRNRFFVWKDPAHKRDLVIFLGEAQPPIGKYAFCRHLVHYATDLGIERVYTFAAMATQMHPHQHSRVFGVATDHKNLEELQRLDLEILESGQISGLNGVLLGAAIENGLNGACLLGEMPHVFSQLPFPRASLEILKVFARITGMELDFSLLHEQVRTADEHLGELLAQMEQAYGQSYPHAEESVATEPAEPERRMKPEDQQRLEQLFAAAAHDRSKAFELKQELDRLGVFKDFEDRFLDLFKKPEQGPDAA